jgi:diacylglycerol kinase
MKNKTFWESVKCAIKGQIYGYKTEKNFRTYTFIVLFFTIINILLKVHPLAYLYLIVSGLGAFSLECINTAIEHLCNLITKEYDEKIKNIKDLAAGGVLYFGYAFFIGEFLIVGYYLWKMLI